ncbi:hypothetical protein DL93DRAFT_1362459 [Clavulina sp. PMI_390]|nr:hypothetical protein DL93DRAFT_1362459 [Clavulina sp. PMI_390]
MINTKAAISYRSHAPRRSSKLIEIRSGHIFFVAVEDTGTGRITVWRRRQYPIVPTIFVERCSRWALSSLHCCPPLIYMEMSTDPNPSSAHPASDSRLQQQHQHGSDQHKNKPKCKGGFEPLSVEDFDRLFTSTELSDLIVENVTHWKKDSWPLYHEFVTIKTAPRALTSTSSLPVLNSTSGTQFDWSSVADYGLIFRIDRDQRAPDGSDQYDSILHRHPRDLVEIMVPNALVPDGVHNIFEIGPSDERLFEGIDEYSPLRDTLRPRTITCHINLRWKGHFPFIVLDRLRGGDPRATPHDDPNSLRVRDFIYFLKKHIEHSNFYSITEWNCWGLASSLIRFIQHYRLDYNFDSLAFPGDSLPLHNSDWKVTKKNGKNVLATPLRMRFRAKGLLSNPGSFLATWEDEFWTDKQAMIDDKILNSQLVPNMDLDLASLGLDLASLGFEVPGLVHRNVAKSLLDIPQRGHLGFLLSKRPFVHRLDNTYEVLDIRETFDRISRWTGDMARAGLIDELMETITTVCTSTLQGRLKPGQEDFIRFVTLFLKHDPSATLMAMINHEVLPMMASCLRAANNHDLLVIVTFVIQVIGDVDSGPEILGAIPDMVDSMLEAAKSASYKRSMIYIFMSSIRLQTTWTGW